MPLCEGRSDRPGVTLPCPDNRCDSTVRGRQGDLLLCDDCNEYRFPTVVSGAAVKELSTEIATTSTVDVDSDDSDADDLATGVDRYMRCEMLYFVQNKCGVLAVDKLVSICSNFYQNHEVDAARNLLGMLSGKRLTKHIGGTDAERRERTVADIVKLCLTPTIVLPTFYSVDMARIPPVGIEHVDVSALLKEVAALREEVRSFATVRTEVAAVRQLLSSVTPSSSQHAAAVVTQSSMNKAEIAKPDNPLDEMPIIGSNAAAMAGNDAQSGPTFAALASSLKDTGMAAAKKAAVKKPTTRLTVVGRSTTTSKLKSVVTRRPVDMFVSRLHPDTEPSDLVNCVKDVLGEDCGDIECNKLKSKFALLYASYHISVSTDVRDLKRVIELLNAADSWPEGVLVRRYFKPKDG